MRIISKKRECKFQSCNFLSLSSRKEGLKHTSILSILLALVVLQRQQCFPRKFVNEMERCEFVLKSVHEVLAYDASFNSRFHNNKFLLRNIKHTPYKTNAVRFYVVFFCIHRPFSSLRKQYDLNISQSKKTILN